MFEVASRLATASRPEVLDRLGFRPDDAADLTAVVERVLGRNDDLHRVEVLAERLIAQIGWFSEPPDHMFDHPAAADDQYGPGVFPLLSLLLTVDDVIDFHHSRRIPIDVSWQTLSDLGQQVWVHRRTYGGFGLHTQGWLTVAWSGALYWLGRLQFNLLGRPDNADWWLSTHIAETGPLTPASVDDSFARARSFFAEHFGDHQVAGFHCSSWLLDPQLTAAVGPDSNMGRFQRRWRLEGPPRLGDDDALFFTFRERGHVDLAGLPRDTTLQRAVIDRIAAGGHWQVWDGYLDLDHPEREQERLRTAVGGRG